MKNTEQIAETVLKIRDAEQEKIMLRNRHIKRVTAGASSLLVFCAVILAVRNLNASHGKIPTIDNNHVIDIETSSKGEEKIRTESTDEERQQETNSDSAEITSNIASEGRNTETSGREPVENNSSPTEQQTEGTGNENAIIPKWNERTLPTQFMEFDLKGIGYNTKDHIIEGSYIGGILGNVTMEGQDVYEDKIYSINAEVFGINSISSNCAVAVKFDGYDNYYVYINREYSPATLGELVDALKLNDTISFGALTPDDRTFVTDYNKSFISGLLNEYRDCATLFDYVGHRKLFSVSASVDILGINNKSLAITEDGYITTNIMERGYAFYIGEDNARGIADRLGIDSIERDTTPQDFNLQEEVVYEE